MHSFVEVSHCIEAGMKTYPGLPVPSAEVFMDYDASHGKYAAGTEFFIANLHLCGNTGTYVDSPMHRYRSGTDLAGLPLSSLAHLPVQVIDCTTLPDRAIDADVLCGRKLENAAVLFRTGWCRYWSTDRYFEPNPFLTEACCRALVDSRVLFAGIDSLNIDDIQDISRPAHTVLLGAGIPVCEHMTNLQSIPSAGGYLHAVPIAWRGGATFPVRAYVVTSEC